MNSCHLARLVGLRWRKRAMEGTQPTLQRDVEWTQRLVEVMDELIEQLGRGDTRHNGDEVLSINAASMLLRGEAGGQTRSWNKLVADLIA